MTAFFVREWRQFSVAEVRVRGGVHTAQGVGGGVAGSRSEARPAQGHGHLGRRGKIHEGPKGHKDLLRLPCLVAGQPILRTLALPFKENCLQKVKKILVWCSLDLVLACDARA